ncbi:hypothetical protein SAMN02745885_02125 [Carboxydocella sporoproducens DSM 16521]|uniref:Uncharacterized protein n=2 Tax=Carboxydocella TaxID=178898 RepID=A0A1T4RHA9_9FIRM|nr:hypothetical protein CFE_0324 [Carboxydocella thermautotrophica]SKA15355.1 hypothetical protein SAMN02745885_02125 [Carboxydocella sporoproducens DSM 16521]
MTIWSYICNAISTIIPSLAHNRGILMGFSQMPLASALSNFLPCFALVFIAFTLWFTLFQSPIIFCTSLFRFRRYNPYSLTILKFFYRWPCQVSSYVLGCPFYIFHPPLCIYVKFFLIILYITYLFVLALLCFSNISVSTSPAIPFYQAFLKYSYGIKLIPFPILFLSIAPSVTKT